MSGASPETAFPRGVADKSRKSALLSAIRMALRVESSAVRHNTQTFNRGRYAAVATLPGYERLKDSAKSIKEEAISRLPQLLETLEISVQRNGGHFFLAKDGASASNYIAEVCQRSGVSLVVKGKSMTSEEVSLNRVLESAGIEVVETDLAEFILQAADEQPSHIIGPAIHYSRERITELFRRVFRTDRPLETGEELTAFARNYLREKFLKADAGVTGANLIAADSGTIMLVESEANIRMSCLVPPLHIAIAGVEKVVPSRMDFAPFVELLAASATGQPLASYTSIICPPLDGAPLLIEDASLRRREFHLVLVDNGRLKLREDRALREALRCIRCSACLNVCANFQTVGGHAFGGETYSGGIGGTWEACTRGLPQARFSELCTGCSRCIPQCPVRIDIPWLNTTLRHRLSAQKANLSKNMVDTSSAGIPLDDVGAPLQKKFFARYDVMGKWGVRTAPIANALMQVRAFRSILERAVGLDRRRKLPAFPNCTFVRAARRRQVEVTPDTQGLKSGARVVLFADVFTNYGSPDRGLATLDVLKFLGVDVAVSGSWPDGRAALSQGLISTAAAQARSTASRLRPYLESGRDIVVIEPSVLGMFRMEYGRLLADSQQRDLISRLQACSFDAAEFIWNCLQKNGYEAHQLFPAASSPRGTHIFLHSHCQLKTLGAEVATESLLLAAGFNVTKSRVECCGMAGSFGYKSEFYELSMAVGEDLFQQVLAAETPGQKRILVATGVSCQEQLNAGLGREVLHPVQLLAEILQARSSQEL